MENSGIISSHASEMSANTLDNGRFSNRAARFYWADEEPTPMRAYSIQQLGKSLSESHFEESPLVIAAISAGVIGVAIIIIILVGIWIRSRLFMVAERRSSENQNNVSVRSSLSTLDEETYVVCMEMDNGAALGSMHNDAIIEVESTDKNLTHSEDKQDVVPALSEQSSDVAQQAIDNDYTSKTTDISLSAAETIVQ